MQIKDFQITSSGGLAFSATLRQSSAIVFQPDVRVQLLREGEKKPFYARDLAGAGYAIAWLPRGAYLLQCRLHDLDLPAGGYRMRITAAAEVGGARRTEDDAWSDFRLATPLSAAGLGQPAWQLQSAAGTPAIEELGWNRGHEDWFFRHFDHAARVVTHFLLQRHPMLKGRILDVGCGDGIIDLGIYLRMRPEELVGIDPGRGFDRLPEILEANHLPVDVLEDDRLSFAAEDANALPWPDDHFDVVVSWGSLEHIAGGYGQALDEIRRVLRNGGLFFVHPGLYFGALGNHLGEFFDDPFVHLKLPEEELRSAVLQTDPSRIDRAGHIATPEEYWQWYTELNPIRLGDFEQELRDRGFEPWRAAVRTSDIIEYTPELQGHSIQDLATAEVYLSAWNRK